MQVAKDIIGPLVVVVVVTMVSLWSLSLFLWRCSRSRALLLLRLVLVVLDACRSLSGSPKGGVYYVSSPKDALLYACSNRRYDREDRKNTVCNDYPLLTGLVPACQTKITGGCRPFVQLQL